MKNKLIQYFITKRSGSWMCQCGYGEFNRNTRHMLKHILANHAAKVKEITQKVEL